MPKVSIITPAYGSEQYIGETIQSVIDQELEDWEMIILNDGSPDDLESVVRSYQLKEPRIRYYKQENQGMCATRNNAVKYATGSYYAFLDNDDLWHPNNLRLKVQLLDEHPHWGLVHSDTQIVDGASKPQATYLEGKSGWILEYLLSWNGTCIPAPSSILVRADAHHAVGGFDPNTSIAGDKDYFIRIATKYEIGRLPQVTWNYRVHGHNFHNNITIMEKDELYVLAKNSEQNLYKSKQFQLKCHSNTYMVLGKSWWKNGGNTLRGIRFILKALWTYPPNIKKLIS